MRVLITGGAGYLGSVLTHELLVRGFEVTVLDNFTYRQQSLNHLCVHPKLRIVRGDARDRSVVSPLLDDVDAVIALAAIVGAPACDLNPLEAKATNEDGIDMLLELMSYQQQLIFPCTNSGYGLGGEAECTEASALRPVSLYGRLKVRAESSVLRHPKGISLRFATLFGASPRMRLDLMVNDFVYRAVRDHALVLFEPEFRRNFLHVRDAAKAIFYMLDGRPGVYNVGDSRANLTKRQLCGEITKQVPQFGWHESRHLKDPDQRNYVVSNAKIEATGWRPEHSLADGIQELIRCYQQPFGRHRNA